MSLMKEKMKEEKEYITGMIATCDRIRENAPKGKLRVSGTLKNPLFYLVEKDSKGKKVQTYLSKVNQSELIACLVQKRYADKVKRYAENQLKELMNLEKTYQECDIGSVYENMKESCKKYITKLVLSDEEYAQKWQKDNVGEQNSYENREEFYTENGEHVRSKTEMIIADRLMHLSIPYKYEPKIILDDGNVKCPDFLILNKRTRKEYYWEHLGRMGDLQYVKRNMEKLAIYERNGILIGKNLIVTMEADDIPISSRTIDKYIEAYLL